MIWYPIVTVLHYVLYYQCILYHITSWFSGRRAALSMKSRRRSTRRIARRSSAWKMFKGKSLLVLVLVLLIIMTHILLIILCSIGLVHFSRGGSFAVLHLRYCSILRVYISDIVQFYMGDFREPGALQLHISNIVQRSVSVHIFLSLFSFTVFLRNLLPRFIFAENRGDLRRPSCSRLNRPTSIAECRGDLRRRRIRAKTARKHQDPGSWNSLQPVLKSSIWKNRPSPWSHIRILARETPSVGHDHELALVDGLVQVLRVRRREGAPDLCTYTVWCNVMSCSI